MGEVADTLTKKKKKGRPSLLDLQKRALKQQQLLQQKLDEPDEKLRSGFKNPNSLNPATNSGGQSNCRSSNRIEVSDGVDGDDEDERRDKKHRLLHGLNSHGHRDSSNFKSEGCDLDADSSIRRRKIGDSVHGSDETGEKTLKATHILQKSHLESGPVTPLPDKKLLLFILDRLQKKDTYGVFSDPADPKELPDYYEVIKNPMDFSTLRKKLDSGAYVTLEQFERDVFLISTNAMEYNSADTVYFRQARAMLELAKKDFRNLRQESDEEEEAVSQSQQQAKVVKRGRPPGTGLKKHLETSSIDRTTSEISADGDSSRLSGAYNLRKTPPSYRFRQTDSSVRINHYSENQSSLSIDWEKEFPPSVVKAVNKYGMKNVDENRRDTYNQISTSFQEGSIFTMLEDDLKQLTPVGLKTEYGYARSLARYAANLGPVPWRFASRRIETVLPSGIQFGPGWVGEKPKAPPENPNNVAASDDHRIMSPTTSASSTIVGNKETATVDRMLNQETESNVLVRASSQQGLFPNIKQEIDRFPPDLNARLVSPSSNNHQAGSSQHPDLALQL